MFVWKLICQEEISASTKDTNGHEEYRTVPETRFRAQRSTEPLVWQGDELVEVSGSC